MISNLRPRLCENSKFKLREEKFPTIVYRGYVHDYMDIGGRMNQETESRMYCIPVLQDDSRDGGGTITWK